MAIGVIIGAALSHCNFLVGDLIMPLISWATGGIDFAEWRITLRAAVETTRNHRGCGRGLYISYGKFINVLFNFIIIAFSIFLVIKVSTRCPTSLNPRRLKRQKDG